MQLCLFHVYEIFSGVAKLSKNLHYISRAEATETVSENRVLRNMVISRGPSEYVSIIFFIICPYALSTPYVSHVAISKTQLLGFPSVVSILEIQNPQIVPHVLSQNFKTTLMGCISSNRPKHLLHLHHLNQHEFLHDLHYVLIPPSRHSPVDTCSVHQCETTMHATKFIPRV